LLDSCTLVTKLDNNAILLILLFMYVLNDKN